MGRRSVLGIVFGDLRGLMKMSGGPAFSGPKSLAEMRFPSEAHCHFLPAQPSHGPYRFCIQSFVLLVRDILGTGSTAALERCFSNTGRVWTERRTRLDARVGSDILLCHENINRGSFGDCNGHLCLLDFPRGLSGAASTLVACLLPAKGEHACWAPKRASRASFGQNLHQRPASSLPERVPH